MSFLEVVDLSARFSFRLSASTGASRVRLLTRRLCKSKWHVIEVKVTLKSTWDTYVLIGDGLVLALLDEVGEEELKQ